MAGKNRDIQLGHAGVMTVTEGQLAEYADGGYPFLYYQHDSGPFCVDCANQTGCAEDITGADISYEGTPEVCEGCGKAIESAYGNPDEA